MRARLALLLLCSCEPTPPPTEPAALRTKASVQNIRMTDMLEEVLPSPDPTELLAADAPGLAPRFAIPMAVSHTARIDSRQDVWRLRVRSDGAASLSFGFTQYRLPHGAELRIYSERDDRRFDDRHNREHGQLWTPIVRGDWAVLELTAPPGSEPVLVLSQVNVGFRDMGRTGRGEESGDCNVDVVCPAGDEWRREIRSVGALGTGDGRFCSGFLVNSEEGRHFFMTAYHCGIRADNAPSLVVYWNFETSACQGTPDGKLDQFTTGATFRAGGPASDFTLLELDEAPASDFNVYWAGWDASGDVPASATCIHHPNVDEKRISHDKDKLLITGYNTNDPADGSHWRVVDWDVGTTEPGSSGSGLWDQNHRIVGQLHGGGAACGNDSSDWYGRFSVSFDAGMQPFLSPSARRVIDGRDQCAAPSVSIDVTPNPAQAGEPVRFNASITGGQPPYAVQWTLDGAPLCETEACEQVFNGNRSANVRVKVTDATHCAASRGVQLTVVDPTCPPARSDAGGLPLAIPDNGRVEARLTGADVGVATTVRVWLTIKHTYRNDLRVALIAPGGKEVVLSDRAGGAADDLVLEGVPLSGFAGEATAGAWVLSVSDEAAIDTGSIDSFALELVGTCGK